MKGNKKIWALFMAVALVLTSMAAPVQASAENDPAATTYLQNMYSVMNAATSMEANLEASLGYSDTTLQADTMKLTGNIKMNSQNEMSMDMVLDMGLLGVMLGQQTMSIQYIYVKENGKDVVYMCTDGVWSKETAEASTTSTALTTATSSDIIQLLSDAKVAAESQTVNGKDCVVVTANITGATISNIYKQANKADDNKLKKQINKQKKKVNKCQKSVKNKKGKDKKKAKNKLKQEKAVLKALNEAYKSRQNEYKALAKCPAMVYTFSIDKSNNNPVQMKLDMTEFLKAYLAADSETGELADMIKSASLVMNYSNINGNVVITVPAEAKNASSGGGALY